MRNGFATKSMNQVATGAAESLEKAAAIVANPPRRCERANMDFGLWILHSAYFAFCILHFWIEEGHAASKIQNRLYASSCSTFTDTDMTWPPPPMNMPWIGQTSS